MKFTETHEWVEREGSDSACIGITAYAQKEIGEVVYVELPLVGSIVQAQQQVVVLESTKAAIDLYSPVSGKILAINQRLIDQPSLVNHSPEAEGWLYKIQLTDPTEVDQLLDRKAYLAMLCQDDA